MGSKQVSMLFHQNYKLSLEHKKKENFMFPYIRSATILNTNTTTNRIPIHLMNLNATLIPK